MNLKKLLKEYNQYCDNHTWHHITFEAWAWHEYKADVEFIDGNWKILG